MAKGVIPKIKLKLEKCLKNILTSNSGGGNLWKNNVK